MYVTVIEWDGKKPPTTFYNRMEALGLIVRGNKEDRGASPLERRSMRIPEKLRTTNGDITSVIFQEGAVMCASEKTARMVAQYAHEDGAKNVSIVSGTTEEYHMSYDDAQIMQRLEGLFGQRGRPAKDNMRQDWIVTCYEECKAWQVEDVKYVANCPSCHSPNIYSRPGEFVGYAIPPNGDVIEVWKRLRFASGRFEVCEEGTIDPPLKPVITGEDLTTTHLMGQSAKLSAEIKAIELTSGRKMALQILDAIFTAREYLTDKARRDARLQAVLPLYQRGVDPSMASILESPTEWDVLDGAHVDPKMIANAWFNAFRK